MGYVSTNLMSDERVIYTGELHWFVFVPGIILLLVAVCVFWLLPEHGFLSVIALLFAIASLIKAFIFKISTELAITSKRVIAKFGLISRTTVELNHDKVESFHIDQSVFGRIFGFGTVVVCGTGGGKTPIPNIDNPLGFRRQAMNVVDQNSSSSARAEA
jgi:uncharacterized membrane protein YdbT with pleckstrin-like domain